MNVKLVPKTNGAADAAVEGEIGKLEFHPLANVFPLLEGEEFAELVADIQKHGVLEPIVLYEQKVLDGRNRYLAARQTDTPYTTVGWHGECGDPLSFVVSRNMLRRQLTPSQRGMCAAKARAIFDEVANTRRGATLKRGQENPVPVSLPERKGDARDLAGKAFGVSGKLVDQARTVRQAGIPDLATCVEQGRMSVTAGAILARKPEETQRAEIAKAGRTRSRRRVTRQSSAGAEKEQDPKGGRKPGKGIYAAHAAINALMTIPKNDPSRKRGLQMVTDWIRHNP